MKAQLELAVEYLYPIVEHLNKAEAIQSYQRASDAGNDRAEQRLRALQAEN